MKLSMQFPVLFAVLLLSAVPAHAVEELWEKVEPMDHQKTRDGVAQAVLESGASATPERVKAFSERLDGGSPAFPQDFYFFIVGCDLKLYPDPQLPPKGQRKLLSLSLTRVKDYWVANSNISHVEPDGRYVPDDDPTQRKPADIKRWDYFKDASPANAVGLLLKDLQARGKVYDPKNPADPAVSCKEK